MKKAKIFSILIFLIVLLFGETYRRYRTFMFDKSFFERAINIKLDNDYQVETLHKESFLGFLSNDMHREIALKNLDIDRQHEWVGWKPQPRNGFEKGEKTMEWERIYVHSGAAQLGGTFLISISEATKGSSEIRIYVYTQ